MRASASSACSRLSWFFPTSLSRDQRIRSIPRSRYSGLMSRIRTSWPWSAASSAMPWPISPAPMTAIFMGRRSVGRIARAELKTWSGAGRPTETFCWFEAVARQTMADTATTVWIVAATFAAILVPFAVVPEILERLGYNPRRAFVRGIVWALFLTIVLAPAAATGFLFSVTNVADWVLFVLALAVAILYDYYRLNPTKVPWARART